MNMQLNKYLGNNEDYSNTDLYVLEVIDKLDSDKNFFLALGKTNNDRYLVMTKPVLSGKITTIARTRSKEDAENLFLQMIQDLSVQ